MAGFLTQLSIADALQMVSASGIVGLIVREVLKGKAYKRDNGLRSQNMKDIRTDVGDIKRDIAVIKTENKNNIERCHQHIQTQASINIEIKEHLGDLDSKTYELARKIGG